MLSRIRLSAVTAPFRALVSRLHNQVVYVSPVKKKASPALIVFRQFDPLDPSQAAEGGYYFSQRAGRDSVAFLLYDRDRPHAPYGALKQWHGPLSRFTVGAYTGSMDKPGLGATTIVIEEVAEEAGFAVSLENIAHLVSMPVSGQCNEVVHLFVVDVSGLIPSGIKPENEFEANTERPWMTREQLLAGQDWKSLTIVTHRAS